MSYIGSRDYYQRVSHGEVPGAAVEHIVGYCAVDGNYAPVTYARVWRTPSSAVALEVVSDDNDDSAGASGAREVIIIGLDASWNVVIETVAMNGTTPVPVPTQMTRVNFFAVNASGTYATTGQQSHEGTITLREAGGGQVWAEIGEDPKPMGRAMIGCLAVSTGTKVYVLSTHVAAKVGLGGPPARAPEPIDLMIEVRPNADVDSAPYSAKRVASLARGILDVSAVTPFSPAGPIEGPCDIFVQARSDEDAFVTSDIEFLILEGDA